MWRPIILGCMFVLLVQANGICQEADEFGANIHFGIKAGVNVSSASAFNAQNATADPLPGFTVGELISVPMGKFFGLQPEFMYSRKGFMVNGSVNGVPYRYARLTDYFDIPVQVQLRPATFLTILAGPDFSFFLKSSNVFEGDFPSDMQQDFDSDNPRKCVIAAFGGADINIMRMIISARIGYDVQSNNGYGTVYSPNYKNFWIQGTFGFRF